MRTIKSARLVSIAFNKDGMGTINVGSLDIGWAVQQMRMGNKVYRTGWNGSGQHIALMEPDNDEHMSLPYIYICTVQGHLVPWLCSQTDLLAEDWELR
jgi:hypothetical protein